MTRLPLLASLLLGACASTQGSPIVAPSRAPELAVLPATAPREEVAQRTPAVHIVEGQFGARKLDDDFDPVERQFAWGFVYAFQPASSWFGVEGGVQAAARSEDESGVDTDMGEVEIFVGPRMTFLRDQMVQPYVGFGITSIAVGVDVEDGIIDDDDDDTSVGFYGHAGVAVNPVTGLRFGFDARFVTGTDVTLFGSDTDVDYTQFAGFVGWGF